MVEDSKEQKQERLGRLYGRKWKITIFKAAMKKDSSGKEIRDPEHDIVIDVSNLRCVFKTEQKLSANSTALCTLIVYNMNAATEGEVIKNGFKISIEGGYKEGQYGEIFTGDIVQLFRNREDGVNYRLEIIAIKAIKEIAENWVKSTLAAGSTAREILKAVGDNSENKFEIGEVSENIPEQKLPRAKPLFGSVKKYVRYVCTTYDAFSWLDSEGKLTVKKVDDVVPESQLINLTPKNKDGTIRFAGLVGTPTYSDDGINIKMLLDARVKPLTMIKIDNEIIQRQAMHFDTSMSGKSNNHVNQKQQFDVAGEYQVFSVYHSGDTNGNEWFTEVLGISRTGRAGHLIDLTNGKDTIR